MPNHPLVVHCKKTPWDVYVGRDYRDPTGRGKWGNPFEIGVHGTRDEVIAMYREWLLTQPHLMAELPKLRGKVLGCHCQPFPCHASFLAELANAPEPAPP